MAPLLYTKRLPGSSAIGRPSTYWIQSSAASITAQSFFGSV